MTKISVAVGLIYTFFFNSEGGRDQDFRTFPENLKGYFEIYFSNHLFLAGTVPTNIYIYIYIYIYIKKILLF